MKLARKLFSDVLGAIHYKCWESTRHILEFVFFYVFDPGRAMIHVSWFVGSFRGLFYDAVVVKKLYRKFPTTCSLSHLALTPLQDVKICKDYSVTLCIASLVRLLVNYVK
jgi:hypothetical protein